MTINAPLQLSIALALAGLIVVLRPTRSLQARIALFGVLLVALSAGAIRIAIPREARIVVMVDLSASTRTADYRDQGRRDATIKQLLPGKTYELRTFAGDGASETDFDPPSDADCVVLFSDARFARTGNLGAPIFIVVDPALVHPDDAAIERVESHDGEVSLAVRNAGSRERALRIDGAAALPIPAGGGIISTRAKSGVARIVGPPDAWPENDAVELPPEPDRRRERWWVGDDPPSAAWRAIDPAQLPDDAARYLDTSVIVLNDIPADAINGAARVRLAQYVRDLGGGLVIIGGPRAFGAGGYVGTPLDAISPLASAPPGPQRNWIILLDASGSMAAKLPDGLSKLQHARSAIDRFVPRLPPADRISLGTFAKDLKWVVQSHAVRDWTSHLIDQGASAEASGPTNLDAALRSIGTQLDALGNSELLIVTDGAAAIDDAPSLASMFRARHATANLLSIGTDPSASNPVGRFVALLGGSSIDEADSTRWTDSLLALARRDIPEFMLDTRTIEVRLTFPGAKHSALAVSRWNQTWLRDGAELLAKADVPNALSARWNYGEGRVAAAAFEADADIVERLADIASDAPRDPRLTIDLTDEARGIGLRIDAIDSGTSLNGLQFTASFAAADDPSRSTLVSDVPQVAPGRYALPLAPSPASRIATIRLVGRAIERLAIPSRFPPEFAEIGNDYDSMHRLADSTGGAVIPSDAQVAIPVPHARREIETSSFFVTVGSLLLLLSFVVPMRR